MGSNSDWAVMKHAADILLGTVDSGVLLFENDGFGSFSEGVSVAASIAPTSCVDYHKIRLYSACKGSHEGARRGRNHLEHDPQIEVEAQREALEIREFGGEQGDLAKG